MDFEENKVHKKVWICEREYELSMLKAEENSFEVIVKAIQEKVLELRTKFEDRDDQDILVMTLIQLLNKMKSDDPSEIDPLELEGRLSAISHAIENAITPNQK